MDEREYKNLIEQLKVDEGFEQFVYKDTVGIETIGYGRNLKDVGVTREEAEHLLANDVNKAMKELEKLLKARNIRPGSISGERFAALTNMMFNLGYGRLNGFERMWTEISRGDWSAAAREAKDSKWATQVGARADRICEVLING